VEVIVTSKFRITIPKKVREALGIKVSDRLLVKVVEGKIVLEPIRSSDALKRLSTIADRILGGPKRVNAVKLLRNLLKEGLVHIDTN